ncbi:MAG: hypothetical protein JNM56_23655 [Planctomycetia bacterium]|nr:hypothetical protein [Planctomycetia bacterium]
MPSQSPGLLRILTVAAVLLGASTARAELRTLEVISRQPFAEGMEYGSAGAYERIVAVGRFAVDPAHARNRGIVDLDKAPKDETGKVLFESDVVILTPKDPARGNGALLYDVNNRGNKLAVRFFNLGGGGNDPLSKVDAGDGFLFRRGYTVVWCGWIGELLPGNHRLLLKAPVATENGKPIRGPVRFEMTTDAPTETLPLSQREGHGSYSPTPAGEKNAVLTWRLREDGERVVIPRAQWSLEKQPLPEVKEGVAGTLPQIRCRVQGGFRPGYIYEMICECENPIVQGLGFAAIRDLVSFLKYDGSKQNPLLNQAGKPVISRAHGFGVSQSGRCLRTFVWQGFNADETDRKVFDGLIPHVAGGGIGFFNHRFAQPTRHNGQQENHTYFGDAFPFNYGEGVDPHSKRADGILLKLQKENPKFLPKIMHTQSAAEYWHRSGSLVHTDPLGSKDATIPDNVRIYAFGGTQHGPAADPNARGAAENMVNPGDFRPIMRALLEALDAWVKNDTAPPPSAYPRIDQGTLVYWSQKSTGFPSLPGVRYPEVIQRPCYLDFGPDFWTKGIITVEPPKQGGQYFVMVPKSGSDGNDLGTLLPAEVAVPLATYTGWNLRRRDVGAEAALANLLGSYIPFAKTKAEREKTGDPRASIEERYGSFEKYQKEFANKCTDMVGRRVLLQEDADRLIREREKVKDQFAK